MARASAKHRKGIAESLATVTPALLTTDRGRPSDKDIRAALYGWSFNKARREAGPPPAHLVSTVTWLAANTIKLSVLADDAGRTRQALDALTVQLNGKDAAASTVARKRAILFGALRYAVELRLIDHHPLDRVKWEAPKRAGDVDRGAVVNPRQTAALLAAVRDRTPELEAFYGCLYYAALRPEEALHLREDEYERPRQPDGWGWLHLSGATVTVGHGWGDQDSVIEDRGLKHRAKTATRDVPAAPPLCALLDAHLAKYGAGPGGGCSSPGAAPAG